MRLVTCLTLCLFLSVSVLAQTVYVSLGGGLINYGGDLQEKPFTVNQAHAYYQGVLGVKLTDHVSVNYLLGIGNISATDADPTAKHHYRNLSFASKIGETSLNLEYDFFDISGMNNFTPYVYLGAGVFEFKPYALDTGGNKVYLQPLGTEGQGIPGYSDQKLYRLVQFQIPFGFGFKVAVSPHVAIGSELSFRKIFTDYLDDVSSATYADTAVINAARGPIAAKFSYRADEIPGSRYQITEQRGNPNKKDTYYTFALKVIITFDKSLYVF